MDLKQCNDHNETPKEIDDILSVYKFTEDEKQKLIDKMIDDEDKFGRVSGILIQNCTLRWHMESMQEIASRGKSNVKGFFFIDYDLIVRISKMGPDEKKPLPVQYVRLGNISQFEWTKKAQNMIRHRVNFCDPKNDFVLVMGANVSSTVIFVQNFYFVHGQVKPTPPYYSKPLNQRLLRQ
jgi:hypothetical protein